METIRVCSHYVGLTIVFLLQLFSVRTNILDFCAFVQTHPDTVERGHGAFTDSLLVQVLFFFFSSGNRLVRRLNEENSCGHTHVDGTLITIKLSD